MNPLLAQFLVEAADLLVQVDEGLLQLELDPSDAELINEVFRAAHTFKGSSGLFDFPELTRLTHAAEDLLDAVRAGRIPLDAAMTDDLLATFDLIRGWLAHVTSTERLPGTAAADAATLITRLRTPLGGPATGAAAPVPAFSATAEPSTTAPAWLTVLGDEWLRTTAAWLETTSSTMRFVRYVPDQDCFFRGEDPLFLIRQTAAIDRMVMLPPAAWPAEPEYDEYACLLGFAVATRAATGELNHLFRYVPDQVETVELGAGAILSRLDGDPAADPADTPAATGSGGPGVRSGGVGSLSADACAVLRAVLRSLATDSLANETGSRLTALIRCVDGAARALGTPVDPEPADRATLEATVRQLLAEADCADPPAEAAAPVASAVPAELDVADPRRRATDTVQVGNRILKVDQEKIDQLMELVGELIVAKNGLMFLAEVAEKEFGNRILSRRIKDQYAGIHRLAEELQVAVMDVRMLPLSVSFARFPRLVRDLSRRLGKNIQLVTAGEDTMADKDVIEALGDPLVHLVRNSLDHGIEPADDRLAAGKAATARLTLAAVADGDAVVVEVADDGRGVDPQRVKSKAYEKGLISEEQLATLSDVDAVNLVFLPGFSTSDTVSDLSGRGVGMDAVRASVEKLGGSVTMRSEFGAGTTTQLRLPLSMAVTQVIVVSVAGQRFGIPVDLVVETVRVPAGDVDRILHQDVVALRGEVVPVVDLADALGMPWEPPPDADRAVLVATVNGHRVGLLVEGFHREVDVILKPTEGLLAGAAEFSGTALLGDGLVLLVLNVKEVLGLAARTA